ncbi:hypothetical protein RCL1_007093 [Eukaryota sp. TZLM3-RCL]
MNFLFDQYGNPLEIPSPSEPSDDSDVSDPYDFHGEFEESSQSSSPLSFHQPAQHHIRTFSDPLRSLSPVHIPINIKPPVSPPKAPDRPLVLDKDSPPPSKPTNRQPSYKSSFSFSPSTRFNSIIGLTPACTEHFSITSPCSASIIHPTKRTSHDLIVDRCFSFTQYSFFDFSFTLSNFLSKNLWRTRNLVISNSFELLFRNQSLTSLIESTISKLIADDYTVKVAIVSITPQRIIDVVGNLTLPSDCKSLQPATLSKINVIGDYTSLIDRLSRNYDLSNVVVLSSIFVNKPSEFTEEPLHRSFLLLSSNYSSKVQGFNQFFSQNITSLRESLVSNGSQSNSFRDRRLLRLIEPYLSKGSITTVILTDGAPLTIKNDWLLFHLACDCVKGGQVIEIIDKNFLEQPHSTPSESRPRQRQITPITSRLSDRQLMSRHFKESQELKLKLDKLEKQNHLLIQRNRKLSSELDLLREEYSSSLKEISEQAEVQSNVQKEYIFELQSKYEAQNNTIKQLLNDLDELMIDKEVKNRQDQSKVVESRSESDRQYEIQIFSELRSLIARQQRQIDSLSSIQPREGLSNSDTLSVILTLIYDTAKAIVESSTLPEEKFPEPEPDIDCDTPESIESEDIFHSDNYIRASVSASSYHSSLNRLKQSLACFESVVNSEVISEETICSVASLLDDIHACSASSSKTTTYMFPN